MSVPFFYISQYDNTQDHITLDEENSKHVVQVLRMKKGEQLNLTDGKGNLLTAEIVDAHKKHCELRVVDSPAFAEATAGKRLTPHDSRKITIAISLLKTS